MNLGMKPTLGIKKNTIGYAYLEESKPIKIIKKLFGKKTNKELQDEALKELNHSINTIGFNKTLEKAKEESLKNKNYTN